MRVQGTWLSGSKSHCSISRTEHVLSINGKKKQHSKIGAIFKQIWKVVKLVMAFTVSLGKTEDFKSDSANLRLYFEDNYSRMSTADYKAEVIKIRKGASWLKDYYFLTTCYLVSRYSYNYHHLFFAFSIVFAFFMVLSMKILVNNENFSNSIICLFLFALFSTNFIENINGMRFWTAAWVGVFVTLKVFVEEKKLYLLLLGITPLIHASFYFFILVFLIYYFASDKKSRWINFYYFSFFFSGISTFIVATFIGYIPALERFLTYVDEDSAYRLFERQSIQKIIFDIIGILYINLMFYLVFLKYKKERELKLKRLYDFTLVFITIMNFVVFVPSLGPRYFMMLYPVVACLWLANFGTKQYKKVIYFMPIAMLSTFNSIALLFPRFLEKSFYITNPVTLFFRYLIDFSYQPY